MNSSYSQQDRQELPSPIVGHVLTGEGGGGGGSSLRYKASLARNNRSEENEKLKNRKNI